MIRIKWKCDHCGHKNKWVWSVWDGPEDISNWYCEKCDKQNRFQIYEKRPEEWRRKKPCKHEATPGIAYYKCEKCGELFTGAVGLPWSKSRSKKDGI